MGTVKMSMGQGFGQIITNLAREKYTEALNPIEAINFLQEALRGLPRDLALQILSNEGVLFEDLATQEVIFSCIPEESRKFDLPQWLDWKVTTHYEAGKDLQEWLQNFRQHVVDNNGQFVVTVKYTALLRYLWDGDADSLLSCDPDDRAFYISSMIRAIHSFVETAMKLKELEKWTYATYPHLFSSPRVPWLDNQILDMANTMSTLMLGDNDVDAILHRMSMGETMLTSYIRNELQHIEDYKATIEPVSITDNYDAGWLSPTGQFYGMNGTTANLLHIKIADRLLLSQIIPLTKLTVSEQNNPEQWLEANGWVRIHGDVVRFAGYDSVTADKYVPLTQTQMDALIEYGDSCWGGTLKIGWDSKMMRTSQLRSIEQPMWSKLF